MTRSRAWHEKQEIESMTQEWFEMRPVGLEFLDRAPVRIEVSVETRLSRREVWAAFIDAPSWSTWFPGVREASYQERSLPHGVGTIRRANVDGTFFDETILAWDEPTRWIYRIDRCSRELAAAQVEATLMHEMAGGGTRIDWILACDPLASMAAAAAVLPRILEEKLSAAVHNLERDSRTVADTADEKEPS